MARVSADVRRRELVAAAIRVMARDGVAKTTTRAIVTEADMQLGFFHYCFRSKQELLLQVIDTINQRNVIAATAVVGQGRGLKETLAASLRAYWQDVETNPGTHQVTYELTQYALRTPGLADVARRQYEGYLAMATEFLETAADAARVEWTTPVPVLARYVHTMLDGVTLAWIVDRDGAQAMAVLTEFADHLAKSARRRRAARAS
ncbi:MAG TPA: TetR family transcriptional regulator [Pseudonocardiaceae bacterium]|nr:TetR family transcriptional regulator [Pseudonocardiaceae bacterium]